MPDYGHDLIFGTFATPSARDPERVVALAEAAEAAGLDAVTFQDHPYNPDFLDTYTLLAWVAARTSRIKVSANVTNLPLRPPVVLAKAAASIDLLSGGRFELGFGAGGIGEAIRSIGGPDLTAGERVAAAEEAIDIIRGIWRGDGSMLKHRGKHYDIVGARSGPRPAHDIGIWLGAYKPRMLRLTGAKADGWLPTYEYLKSPDMAEANRLIDDSAREAGRDPRAVRRLLNIMRVGLGPVNRGFLQGPAEQWVEQLTEFVLEHGFSAFFIGGDDPALIRAFGEDIAPAVRAAVAKARGEARADTTAATAVTKAGRVPGIAYDALPPSLAADAIEPGDARYRSVRHSYVWRGSPGLVLQPRSAAAVAEALRFARAQAVPLSVRSGGHGVSGRSTNTGGIIIDLRHLNRVAILDRAKRLVRVEPGARWGEVAAALEPHGLAISSGDYGDVGAGGLATTGGVGYLARSYGLTIDHVRAAEVVLADGRIVRADATHEPDLFWALRGAGGNFGIVTAFEIEAEEIGKVVQLTQVFDASEPAVFLQNWARIVEAAPRVVTSFLYAFPDGSGGAVVAQAATVYAGDDTDAAIAALTPLTEAGPLLDQKAYLVPYAALVPAHGGTQRGSSDPATVRSGLADHITPDIAERLAAIVASGKASVLQIRSVGGAVNDVPPDATAYAHRSQNFAINVAAVPGSDAAIEAAWADLRPLLKGMYLSFETDTRPERLLDAFPEPVLSRLRLLKAKYDPDNIFNRNFAIPPAEALKAAS